MSATFLPLVISPPVILDSVSPSRVCQVRSQDVAVTLSGSGFLKRYSGAPSRPVVQFAGVEVPLLADDAGSPACLPFVADDNATGGLGPIDNCESLVVSLASTDTEPDLLTTPGFVSISILNQSPNDCMGTFAFSTDLQVVDFPVIYDMQPRSLCGDSPSPVATITGLAFGEGVNALLRTVDEDLLATEVQVVLFLWQKREQKLFTSSECFSYLALFVS